MKKSIPIRSSIAILSAMLTAAACTVSGFAEETESAADSESEEQIVEYTSGDYTYSHLVNENDENEVAACILSYSGNEENLVIPSELDGLEVVQLGDVAFAEAGFLKTVTLPKTITQIGNYTFANCVNLEAYQVEEGNTVYSAKDGILYANDGTALMRWPVAACPANVTIPEGVTQIGNVAFAGAKKLETVTMTDDVEYIGLSAFAECGLLNDIALSNNLTMITDFMFNSCTSLKSIELSDGIQYIGHAAFAATGLESIVIPSTVVEIGQQAFAGTPMTEITIPYSVQDIGFSAFGWKLNDANELYMDEKFVIHGAKGSAAETYATDEDNENNFIFIDDVEPVASSDSSGASSDSESSESDASAETSADAAQTDSQTPDESSGKLSKVQLIGICGCVGALLGILCAVIISSKKKKSGTDAADIQEDESKGEPKDE